MTQKTRIPETVGELIEMLKACPSDTELSISITEIYDNGSVYPSQAYMMEISKPEYCNSVEITFANGHTLP